MIIYFNDFNIRGVFCLSHNSNLVLVKLDLYQIDAFANKIFEGNPAAVIPLDQWLPNEVMQSIAQENNLSETHFVNRQ